MERGELGIEKIAGNGEGRIRNEEERIRNREDVLEWRRESWE
jgi:hypothetical protein